LHSDQISSGASSLIDFKAKGNCLAGPFQQFIHGFSLRMATREFRDLRDEIPFFVLFNDNCKFFFHMLPSPIVLRSSLENVVRKYKRNASCKNHELIELCHCCPPLLSLPSLPPLPHRGPATLATAAQPPCHSCHFLPVTSVTAAKRPCCHFCHCGVAALSLLSLSPCHFCHCRVAALLSLLPLRRSSIVTSF